MTISFKELCAIIASAKSIESNFWKDDPLYIEMGAYAIRRVEQSEPYNVDGDPDIVIDVDSEGNALGIEFAPL